MNLPVARRGFVQIAGVLSVAEAGQLCEFSPDAIGLPYLLNGRREELDHPTFLKIVRSLPPTVMSIWITYYEKLSEILPIVQESRVNGVQLHGNVSPNLAAEIKHQVPGIFLIKSLIVGKGTLNDLEKEVKLFTPFVDAFLTDTWEPSTGKSGATGKTHDWSVSARLVDVSERPVILAGGLNAENVAQSIASTGAWGVDSHTGLEDAQGNKDLARVKSFIARARQTFLSLSRELPEKDS